MGLREQIIFPEINYDKIDKVKGLNISFVTTARTTSRGWRCCATSACRSAIESREPQMAKLQESPS